MLSLVHIKRQLQALEHTRDTIARQSWRLLIKKCIVIRRQMNQTFTGVVLLVGRRKLITSRAPSPPLEINSALRYLHENY